MDDRLKPTRRTNPVEVLFHDRRIPRLPRTSKRLHARRRYRHVLQDENCTFYRVFLLKSIKGIK